MQALLQFVIAIFAIWCAWWLLRRIRRNSAELARAEDPLAEDPLAEVPTPTRRGPKGLAGAVALEEPDDDGPADAFPPRTT